MVVCTERALRRGISIHPASSTSPCVARDPGAGPGTKEPRQPHHEAPHQLLELVQQFGQIRARPFECASIALGLDRGTDELEVEHALIAGVEQPPDDATKW